MFNIKKFLRGILLVPKTTLESDSKGELEVDNTSGKLNFHNGTTRSPVVTEAHTQTLLNKQISASDNTILNLGTGNFAGGVVNTEPDLAGASDVQIPSALAVKTLVENGLAAQNEASEITVDPVGNLTATNAQDALEDHQILIDDLNTLSGVAANSEDLGEFTGVTIPDDSTIKTALQALETELETKASDSDLTDHINDVTDAHDASAISVVPVGNLVADDAQEAFEELQGDIDGINTSLTDHVTASTDVHGIGATASVVGTDTTQTLTNKTITGADIRTPVRSDVKQDTKANLETYALTATNGQLVFATDTKEMFQVVDTLLVPVGSGGGVGGVDILFVQTFEEAALSDFTQTGLVLDETDPLAGEVSAQLTHDDTINQSFKQTIAVDEKFRNRNITLKLNIKSEASAGNVTLTVRDETNAVNLVTSEQLPASNEVGGAIGIVSFNIPATCVSLSYEIIALPEAGSPVTIIDDIIAELSSVSLLSTSITVPVVTGWQGYTPTFQGFGTPTNIEFEWRRVGENVEVRGKFVSGTPTAVEARIGLPNGLTSAGTGLIPSLQVVGYGQRTALAPSQYGILVEPSVTYVTLSSQSITYNGLAKRTGNDLMNSGESMSFFASVPCAGLTANVTETIGLAQSVLVEESDSYLRASGNAGQVMTASVTNIPFANTSQALGSALSFNGSQITVLKEGTYSFNVTAFINASVLNRLGIWINGISGSASGSINSNIHTYATTVYLNVNDIVSFRFVDANVTLTNSTAHVLQASYQGSLKQINVNPNQKITIPTSELRMEGASTRGSTATAIVRFDNIAKIRGDAFEVLSDAVLGTRIVMKKKGKLDVSASLTAVVASAISISKNQQTLTTLPTISETVAIQVNDDGTNLACASGFTFVDVGDTIRVSQTATPSGTLNNLNLTFQEQDISVSVTNTLPQFSESDSSVRVDTSNGYGSSASTTLRFSNVRDNIGTAIEYVPSSVNGDSWIVKETGLYSMAVTYQGNGGSSTVGFTKNMAGAQLSTNIGTLISSARANVLKWTSELDSSFNNIESVSGEFYLQQGDIIRVQTDATVSAAAINNSFTISKVGKPNVTGVDVTPFVNLAFDTGSIGEIKAFAGNVDSTSFLECNGNAVSRSTYAALFDKIGTTHGQGDGSTTFNLPDYRGRFLRGVDGTANRDPDKASRTAMNTGGNTGNNVGSVQGDELKSHKHRSLDGAGSVIRIQSASSLVGTTSSSGVYYDNNLIENTGGNETRPINAYVNYGIRFKAANEAIISPTESFSTDTALLQYAPSSLYTLATLNTAPVGTYITFTYAANTNTRTQTTTRPTQTDADMNVNGLRIFTRAFNSTSTAAEPVVIAIQIGKGLKGKSLDLYKDIGKVTAGNKDSMLSGATEIGLNQQDYNEQTGIILLDAGAAYSGSNTSRIFQFSDLTTQTNGYLVINASKSPVLCSVPALQIRTATLTEQYVSGTAAPTTVASYSARRVNTLVDPTGIVVNSSAFTGTGGTNTQVILSPGSYQVDFTTQVVRGNTTGNLLSKMRLQNITQGTTLLLGTTAQDNNTTGGQNDTSSCTLKGSFVISTESTIEIQQRSNSAGEPMGSPASFGDNEVFLVGTITKVK